MLVIRDEQMAAFQAYRDEQLLPQLVPLVIERLRELEQLPPEGQAPPPEEQEEGAPPPAELDWSEPAVEERVRAGIRAAQALGVHSEGGLVQCLGYEVSHGPKWREHPEVLAALKRPGASEDQRLEAVHRLIATL